MERRPVNVLDGAVTPAGMAGDDVAATKLRDRLTREPPAAITPTAVVAALLGDGESLLAVRRNAAVAPVRPPSDPIADAGADVYLTSHRLLLLSRVVTSVALADIAEVALVGRSLIVALDDGQAIRIQADRPGVFRVNIAAARRALRS
jgi:hypothetical protein